MEHTSSQAQLKNEKPKSPNELDEFASMLRLPRNCNSLCLLVVADLDLHSASALAEDALCQLPDGGTLVDCICACGPFVDRFTDLQPYMSSPSEKAQSSPELTYALEGLVTGCLSQLENIVCRVVWVPSIKKDPISLLSRQSRGIPRKPTQRLTPNSRNVHKECLPLAPGLLCFGLSGSSSIRLDEIGERNHNMEKHYLKNTQNPDVEKDNREEDVATIISKLLSLETSPKRESSGIDTDHPPWLKFSMTSAIVLTTELSSTSLIGQKANNLLLHICAPSSPETKSSYSKGVLIPGSLKHRGEYCLVHLHVASLSPSTYTWKVNKVDFKQLGSGFRYAR